MDANQEVYVYVDFLMQTMQYDRQKEFKKHELSEGMGICSESQTSQMNASRSKLSRQ